MVGSLSFAGQAWGADDLRALAQKGEEAFQKGDYDASIKWYEQAIELNPNFAPLYNALGLSHSARQDRLSDVLWFFDVAVDIDPQYADAYSNKCRVLYRAGEHDKAEEACRKALAITPDLNSAQLNLAWIYLIGKKQPTDAIYYFQQVAEKVKNPMVYFGLGMAYSMNKDNAQVLDMITRLRGMNENSLAAQLETSIRPPDVPTDMGMGDNMAPMDPMSGTLIPAVPEEALFSDSPAIEPGIMKIRLKGRLTTVESTPAPTPDKRHPGSLTPAQ